MQRNPIGGLFSATGLPQKPQEPGLGVSSAAVSEPDAAPRPEAAPGPDAVPGPDATPWSEKKASLPYVNTRGKEMLLSHALKARRAATQRRNPTTAFILTSKPVATCDFHTASDKSFRRLNSSEARNSAAAYIHTYTLLADQVSVLSRCHEQSRAPTQRRAPKQRRNPAPHAAPLPNAAPGPGPNTAPRPHAAGPTQFRGLTK